MAEAKMKINPFTREYHEEEVKSLDLQPATYKGIELKIAESISGRVNGYMYRDFLVDFKNVPVLYIDGELWMSLTPMEIESHYMPNKLAKGKVGVAGLGLGYYVQRILDKEEVKSVTVYEINQDVIDFYYQNFGEHEKLTIVNQDVRKLKRKKFDFFYCDIYPEQIDMMAVEDMALLTNKNKIKVYHFWTMEHALLEMMNDGYMHDIPFDIQRRYFPFIQLFLEEKENIANIIGVGENWAGEFHRYGIF